MSDKNALARQHVPSLPSARPLREADTTPPWNAYAIPTYTRVTIPTRLDRGKQGLLFDVAAELRKLADNVEEIAHDRETPSEFLMSKLINLCKQTNDSVKLHARRRGI